MSHAGFKDAIDALSFIFAGKAIVTMTSAKTDTHFTFKVTRAEDGGAFFVKLPRQLVERQLEVHRLSQGR